MRASSSSRCNGGSLEVESFFGRRSGDSVGGVSRRRPRSTRPLGMTRRQPLIAGTVCARATSAAGSPSSGRRRRRRPRYLCSARRPRRSSARRYPSRARRRRRSPARRPRVCRRRHPRRNPQTAAPRGAAACPRRRTRSRPGAARRGSATSAAAGGSTPRGGVVAATARAALRPGGTCADRAPAKTERERCCGRRPLDGGTWSRPRPVRGLSARQSRGPTTRLRGLSTSRPRRRDLSSQSLDVTAAGSPRRVSPRTIRAAAAASPRRPVHELVPRGRDSLVVRSRQTRRAWKEQRGERNITTTQHQTTNPSARSVRPTAAFFDATTPALLAAA